MRRDEKRTTTGQTTRSAATDPPGAACPVSQGGVGGRQAIQAPPPGGGGYPDICRTTKFPRLATNFGAHLRDPRLDELVRMGLQHHWLNVAEAIGVDAFLVMWRTLDAEDGLQRDPPGAGLLLRLRRYESYQRFQRNRFIESLHADGLSSEQIRQRVASTIGEELSERHIDRLRKQG